MGSLFLFLPYVHYPLFFFSFFLCSPSQASWWLGFAIIDAWFGRCECLSMKLFMVPERKSFWCASIAIVLLFYFASSLSSDLNLWFLLQTRSHFLISHVQRPKDSIDWSSVELLPTILVTSERDTPVTIFAELRSPWYDLHYLFVFW